MFAFLLFLFVRFFTCAVREKIKERFMLILMLRNLSIDQECFVNFVILQTFFYNYVSVGKYLLIYLVCHKKVGSDFPSPE